MLYCQIVMLCDSSFDELVRFVSQFKCKSSHDSKMLVAAGRNGKLTAKVPQRFSEMALQPETDARRG